MAGSVLYSSSFAAASSLTSVSSVSSVCSSWTLAALFFFAGVRFFFGVSGSESSLVAALLRLFGVPFFGVDASASPSSPCFAALVLSWVMCSLTALGVHSIHLSVVLAQLWKIHRLTRAHFRSYGIVVDLDFCCLDDSEQELRHVNFYKGYSFMELWPTRASASAVHFIGILGSSFEKSS